MKDINPKSVVDFGCGIGTWLSSFKSMGVQEILGLDGSWVDKSNFVEDVLDDFQIADLEFPISLTRKYDLAISLEVAEHLSAESARIFVSSLISASDVVLFSAAIPGQDGQNHINEQPLSYWRDLFQEHGYTMYDNIRGRLWNEKELFFWYKQNMVYFSKNELNLLTVIPVDIVHPELLNNVRDRTPTIKSICFDIFLYIKLKLRFK
jgi:hypothetical protein